MEKPINPSSVPPLLTFYRGGLNVGVFRPGPPVYPQGSEIFGNEFQGSPSVYRTQSIDPGEKSYGWVIIVAGKNSDAVIRATNQERDTKSFSSYDGLFNRNQLTTVGKTIISSYRKGNYKDWYIPSKDELAFICKNLPENFSVESRFDAMEHKRYLTSTYVKNQAGKESFLHTQSFSPTTYGVTSFVQDTRLMPVRYIRRVPVYII